MRLRLLTAMALLALTGPQAHAQMDPHAHHRMAPLTPAAADHNAHSHSVGPPGATFDLRWIDAMVQHHTGALRMSELVFDIGAPGVGSLAKAIWQEQAQEIKAMGQWRRAWYPDAPVFPVVLRPGGDPNGMAALSRMTTAQIEAMRMVGSAPTSADRVRWFLEGMLAHHGGALEMAHEALAKSSNPTVRNLARTIIRTQRAEILELRRMLQHDGLNKPEYTRFDALFSLN